MVILCVLVSLLGYEDNTVCPHGLQTMAVLCFMKLGRTQNKRKTREFPKVYFTEWPWKKSGLRGGESTRWDCLLSFGFFAHIQEATLVQGKGVYPPGCLYTQASWGSAWGLGLNQPLPTICSSESSGSAPESCLLKHGAVAQRMACSGSNTCIINQA